MMIEQWSPFPLVRGERSGCPGDDGMAGAAMFFGVRNKNALASFYICPCCERWRKRGQRGRVNCVLKWVSLYIGVSEESEAGWKERDDSGSRGRAARYSGWGVLCC